MISMIEVKDLNHRDLHAFVYMCIGSKIIIPPFNNNIGYAVAIIYAGAPLDVSFLKHILESMESKEEQLQFLCTLVDKAVIEVELKCHCLVIHSENHLYSTLNML